jgi:CheY-like chemotaxis protein
MGKRILLIDDEVLVTKSLVKLLGREGFETVTAATGEEAVDKVDGMEFDLVVSDVRMPGMDGIETIRTIRNRLKELNRNPVPEILITGYADVDRYERAEELKITEYVYKPFDTEEFIKVIKRCLNK